MPTLIPNRIRNAVFSSIRCHRCRGPMSRSDISCSICGAESRYVEVYPSIIEHFVIFAKDLGDRVENSIMELRYRYGTLPVVSLFGLSPFIPLSSLIGVGAGVFGLIRILRRRSPAQGAPLAFLGIFGAIMWFILGLFAVGQFGELVNLVLHEILDLLGPAIQDSGPPGHRSA